VAGVGVNVGVRRGLGLSPCQWNVAYCLPVKIIVLDKHKLAQLKRARSLLFRESHVDGRCDLQVFPLIISQIFQPTRVVAILR